MFTKFKIPLKSRPEFSRYFIGVQIDIFAFSTTPQPLYKHVVDPASLAVRADRNLIVFENASKRFRRKLRTLVRIEHIRCTIAL